MPLNGGGLNRVGEQTATGSLKTVSSRFIYRQELPKFQAVKRPMHQGLKGKLAFFQHTQGQNVRARASS